MVRLTSICCILFLLASVAVGAQTIKRQIQAVRVPTPPLIDGRLDDPCWKSVPSSSGFGDTQLGTPVKDDTTIWIGYDDRCLYVAFYCHDSRPQDIVARETQRGASLSNDDHVTLYINPFNSKRYEDETQLALNPINTQSGRFAGGHAIKQEWEGAWQSAARIVADGWTCEMAIPWNDFVRPPATGKPVTLGINFERYQARTQIYSQWSNLGSNGNTENEGQWVGVILPPVEHLNPLSILGYSFGGYQQGGAGGRAGLDMRYRFTPLLTGVASLNPDFSDIEKAITSIDFSYAEILPNETRPFFLEGGDYYRSYMSGVQPFASVRVPAFDAGAKFYGRVGQGTNLGLLSTQDYSGRNDSVVTVAQQFSPFTSLNLQAVRLGMRGVENTVYALQGGYGRGNWSFDLGGAHSGDASGRGDSANTDLFWGSKAWYAGGGYQWISPNFQARDGYVPFTDERGAFVNFGYGGPWRSGPIRQFNSGINLYRYVHTDGRFFNDGITLYMNLRTVKQLSLFASYSNDRFEQNHDHLYDITFRYPALNKFKNVSIDFAWGTQDGSPYTALGPAINWRFKKRLTVNAASQIVNLNGSQHQHVLSINYDLSKDRAIGGRLVRRNGLMNWYLSYRRSGYGGTEYFIIWGDPNADTFKNRLVFKVVRQF